MRGGTPSGQWASSWQVDGVSRRHELVCLGGRGAKLWVTKQENENCEAGIALDPNSQQGSFSVGMYHFWRGIFRYCPETNCALKNAEGSPASAWSAGTWLLLFSMILAHSLPDMTVTLWHVLKNPPIKKVRTIQTNLESLWLKMRRRLQYSKHYTLNNIVYVYM